MSNTPLNLSEVTLCAADCLRPDLAMRALELSLAQCRFAAAMLFTDRPMPGAVEVRQVAPIRSKEDYSRFILHELHRHVSTTHVLVIQWDGYVLDGCRWRQEFLDYDYIGAKWIDYPDRRVGNGGFSLRSRKLLQATATMPMVAGANEDLLICREWGPALEREHGIRFAPEQLADLFAYERVPPDAPTFGFHGLGNMWRHANDEEMIAIIATLDPRSLFETDYATCLIAYMLQRRLKPLAAMYGRWRKVKEPAEILRLLYDFNVLPRFAEDCVRIGEAMLADGYGA